METVDIQLRPQTGHNVGPSLTEYYRGTDETGGATHLEEVAPTPIAVDYTKAAQFAGDDITTLFFPYYATQNNTDSSSTQLDTSSGVYEHIWTGPSTSGQTLSFSMEDQGDPSVTDDDLNRLVYNVTPTRVSVNGARRGVISVTADLAGGKAEGDSSAPTAGTFSRTKLFNFGMSHCFTSTTLTAAGGSSWFAPDGGLDTDAECLTNTELGGSPVSLTSALQEFNIECTQGLDLQRSMAPGNLTAAFAGYVPTGSDWVFTNEQQQVEFEMLFNSNHAAGSNLVETLLDEYEAGTRRAWEIWIVHPDPQAGAASNAYFGMKVTCPTMTPVSWVEENDGFGERYVRVRYRAGYNTTDTYGWHFAVGSSFATDIGAL